MTALEQLRALLVSWEDEKNPSANDLRLAQDLEATATQELRSDETSLQSLPILTRVQMSKTLSTKQNSLNWCRRQLQQYTSAQQGKTSASVYNSSQDQHQAASQRSKNLHHLEEKKNARKNLLPSSRVNFAREKKNEGFFNSGESGSGVDYVALEKNLEDVGQRSQVYLEQTTQHLVESNAISTTALSTLQDQRVSLLNGNERVVETHNTTQQSREALKRMANKVLYNKIVLYGIIVLLIVLICVVLYKEYIAKH